MTTRTADGTEIVVGDCYWEVAGDHFQLVKVEKLSDIINAITLSCTDPDCTEIGKSIETLSELLYFERKNAEERLLFERELNNVENTISDIKEKMGLDDDLNF
jgi:hypothetical protein